jgi:hypothetical protein
MSQTQENGKRSSWWLPVALAALFGIAGWCGGQLIDLRAAEADHAARLTGIERTLERIENRLERLGLR